MSNRAEGVIFFGYPILDEEGLENEDRYFELMDHDDESGCVIRAKGHYESGEFFVAIEETILEVIWGECKEIHTPVSKHDSRWEELLREYSSRNEIPFHEPAWYLTCCYH